MSFGLSFNTKTYYQNLGANLRRFRTICGLPIVSLAEELGVSHQQYRKYETGDNRIPIEFLEKVCSVLGVSINDLLDPSSKEVSPVASTFSVSVQHIAKDLMLVKDQTALAAIRAIVKSLIKDK
jgi:transcriptional regulator with XRE-family HTH domain